MSPSTAALPWSSSQATFCRPTPRSPVFRSGLRRTGSIAGQADETTRATDVLMGGI
jgi:hypothetical protein